MRKKILSLFVAICMIFPMAFSLVACDKAENTSENQASKQSTIKADNIVLGYSKTVYDGSEKEPSVTLVVDDKIISSNNYSVEYRDNIDAGTATVIVKTNSESELLAANLEFSTTFEIERAPIYVKNFSALTAAIQITDKNHVIKLSDNIEMVRDTTNGGWVVPVLIFPQENQDIAIDLAGFDINSYLWIASDLAGFPVSGAYYGLGSAKPNKTNSTDKTVKLSVYNSAKEESLIGFSSNEDDYAIVMKTNNAYDINFEDITFKGYWGGIYSNGSYSSNTRINAKDCKFIGTKNSGLTYDDVSVGAYLASGKMIYNFNDCEFVGFGGYYAKSGHHYFNDCTIEAVGELSFEKDHNGNGFYVTGSALMIDSCEGYNTIPAAGYQKALTIDIVAGRIVSRSKYAIEEFSSYKNAIDRVSYAFVNVVDDTILTSADGLKPMSFENAEAYHNHSYSSENDSSCNECGANRKILGEDLWDGKVGQLADVVDGVITISTARELAAFAKAVNAGNKFKGITIVLANNINLNNIEWTPIGQGSGSSSNYFAGTFDGKGFTISNLKVTNYVGGSTFAKAAKSVGLFGNIDNPAVIKNVKIDGARVDGNHFVGALVGFASYTKIENCSVKNAVINCNYYNEDDSGDKAGALIGHASNVKANGIFAENSTVKAARDAGQVVGCSAGKTTLRNISAKNVNVLDNGTGTGANIKNEVLGRDSATISLWNGEVGTLPEAVNKVITIKSAQEFAAFAKMVNDGNDFEGYTIKLGKDMDLDSIEWTPIGYGSYSNTTNTIKNDGKVFKGVFDAQNYIVYNLKITEFVGGGTVAETSAGVGLFGNNLGTIKNLTVDGAVVCGNYAVAVIAGFNCGAVIEKCVVKNASVSCIYANAEESGDKAGLICGYVSSRNGVGSQIKNCKGIDSTVDADRDAGQLIGGMAAATTQTGNTVSRVTVSYNASGKNLTAKTHTNIKNELVGRIA